MGFARATTGTKPAKSAIDRARMAWAEMANLTRTDLRRMGIHGGLRVLDDAAAGSRGVAAPTQLSRLAAELRDAGVPLADTMERLTGIARAIAMLTYDDKGAA